MTEGGIKDMAASVRARLLNLARRAGKPYPQEAKSGPAEKVG